MEHSFELPSIDSETFSIFYSKIFRNRNQVSNKMPIKYYSKMIFKIKREREKISQSKYT